MLTAQTSKNWHLNTPVVFRYMDSAYVDQFFADGTLMLCPFARYRSWTDTVRKDGREGLFLQAADVNEDGAIVNVLNFQPRVLALCGSIRYSPELMTQFGVDSYVQINNTTGFGLAVANRLSGFAEGAEGCCVYVTDSEFAQYSAPLSHGKRRWSLLQHERDNLEALSQANGGIDAYFLKQLQYEAQAEYRFLWRILDEIDKPLILKVPEAREYCDTPKPFQGRNQALH